MYVDGASSKTGSGAGILLIGPGPERQEVAYALKFTFKTTNNEVEYEALISGLRLARSLGVKKLRAYSDSQVIVGHVLGNYEAKDERMMKYLDAVKAQVNLFSAFKLERIPRGENSRADVLSKIGSSSSQVPVEEVHARSIEKEEGNQVTDVLPSWMTPIRDYLEKGDLPEDKVRKRQILIRSRKYVIVQDDLYRKSYLQPLLKCLGPEQADYVLREMHEGSCGTHIGPRALSKKVLRWGYYWPTMFQDATDLIKRCQKCQHHSNVTRRPQAHLVGIHSPWPFVQWGIDIVGPLDLAPGQNRFLIVAIDYFTKWVEAAPLAKITSKNALSFVWKNIVCRFGIPHILVSDNGTQFTDKVFREWCEELHIVQKFTSVSHPQANGQTEVTNRTIIQGLKKRLGKAKGDWVENLPQVLWSYRTTPRTSNGETPYSLVYGTEAVIPAEIGVPSPRTQNYSEQQNNDDLRADLDLLEEKREVAYINEARYKAQVAKYYDQRVAQTQFQTGDLVLRNNEASRAEKLGKLEATWEGPYKIHEVLGKGAYRLAHCDGQIVPRTWNINHLRRFYL